ncbi:MAG: hypothetical protein KatS3mg117_3242 [Geminicoccaceae bacterium]|jgi:hypothetical protein|nr:MAG: hypothetical protein KatS3mg117_3242 [Geminicoccaceae bacterium]
MTFRLDAPCDAFAARGEKGLGVRTYVTTDSREEVLQPGCFLRAAPILRTGDPIFSGIAPLPNPPPRLNRPQETRRALSMVAPMEPGQPISTRLVLDFGRPEDPSAAFTRKPTRPTRKSG